jgi:hypothetical protein
LNELSPSTKYALISHYQHGRNAFREQQILCWDLEKEVLVGKFRCGDSGFKARCIQAFDDGRALISDDTFLVLYDFEKQSLVFSLDCGERPSAGAVSPDLDNALTARFWDWPGRRTRGLLSLRGLPSGKPVDTISWTSDGIPFCAFLPGEKSRGMAIDLSGATVFFDLDTLKAEERDFGLEASPRDVRMGDGRALACGVGDRSRNAALIPYRGSKGAQLLVGHRATVLCGAFLPDRRILTVDKAGAACLWLDGPPIRIEAVLSRASRENQDQDLVSAVVASRGNGKEVTLCWGETYEARSGGNVAREAEIVFIDMNSKQCTKRLRVSAGLSRLECPLVFYKTVGIDRFQALEPGAGGR